MNAFHTSVFPVPHSKIELTGDSLNPEQLLGIWMPVRDSAGYDSAGISFVNRGFEFNLIADSFYTYTFSWLNDSLISNSGYMANWPPYSCLVKWINYREIEVKYISVFSEPVTILYRRGD